MSKISDQEYLLTEQYQNASNLNARIQLHVRFSTNQYGLHQWIFDRLDIPPESQVLDLGCGPGDLWLKNLERIPAGWDVTLSDFSMGMLQEAQANLCDSRRRFEFEVIDAQAIPFEDNRFDAVIANHMLYHVPDKARALGEIRRVLRPGGRFYTSTVGQTHLQELSELASRFTPDTDLWGRQPAESFLLENGLEQILQWFPRVTLHRYEDDLIITEAEPLIAYVLSTMAKSSIGDRLTEFVEYVEQEIAQHGAIHITKDTGMFEAW